MIPHGLTIRSNVSGVGTVPWLAEGATDYMEKVLKPDMDVFEWGSGGSTCWFGTRVRSVCSVEHDPEWHDRVTDELNRLGLTNITQRFTQNRDEYINAVDGEYDVVLIDGEPDTRIECLRQAVEHLRSGGIIICDDFGWEEYREGREMMDSWSETSYVSDIHTTMVYRRMQC